MNDLISIIVPVYNVEPYLAKCIDSLINQTYNNIEIILIDDGSNDGSGEICEEYSKIDKRIRVVHEENQGVSHARNVGIELSTGKYITFCDSDDFIENNMYEEIMKKMITDDFEVVIVNYNVIKDNRIIPKKFQIPAEMTKDQFLYYMSKKYFRGFCCNKVYKSELIRETDIRFEEDIAYCEDMLFNVNVGRHIKKAYFMNDNLYNYCIRSTNATTSKFKHKNLPELIAYEKIINIIDKISCSNTIHYKEACLETSFRIKDLYERSSKKSYNEDAGPIYDSINKYYRDVITSKAVTLKRKIYFMINKRFPFLIRFLKTIKNKIGG